MKRVFILSIIFLFTFIFLPLASAEIIINKQPQGVYNLGDVVSVPVTIKTASGVSGFFNMDLLCSRAPINFFRNTVSLSIGEERRMDPSLALIKGVIGESKGNCRIKAYLGDEYVLTNEFKISDLININVRINSSEFSPGENLMIEGTAVKENNKESNGFVELSITEDNSTIFSQIETIRNGFFSINLSFDKRMKAGQYSMRFYVYESEPSGEKTNQGSLIRNIRIRQVPTSFEIFFDSSEIEPGKNLKIKTILYDQSGEKIASNSAITIKNKNDKIVEKKEIATDEFFEFPIAQNEAPSEWKVSAISNNFSGERTFKIIEREMISVEILNKTLVITNTGNVPYNKTALIKIGNQSLSLDVFLDIGKKQEYLLTAPDGEYRVEFISDEHSVSSDVALTGKAIDVKKAVSGGIVFVQRPFVWVFMVFIVGFVAFVFFRKGYKRTFVGYKGGSTLKRKSSDFEGKPLLFSLPAKDSLIPSKENRADISLSIKGEKQEVSIVALQIRNFDEVLAKKEGVKDSFTKISDAAERCKAVVKESNGIIFFILSPTRTKTFKNEKTALDLAQNIKDILKNHNKMFRQKVNFGISLTYGEIIAKVEGGSFKFMSLGNLTTSVKKIASLSNEEVFISDKMNERLLPYAKTTRNETTIPTYSVRDMKNPEEHKKFISKFLERNK